MRRKLRHVRAPALLRVLPGGPDQSLCGAGLIAGAYGETVTVTRSSSKLCETSPSTAVVLSANKGSVEPHGIRIEASYTNSLLHSRDLTNASWTKNNATAALTATGVDGAANSASTLTATANNGYAAQAITASGSRVTSVFLRRRTGTGTVAISRDGGSNYTDVTSSISAVYARVAVNSSVTNPEIRIRLGTSGDAVDVDYVQDEAGAYAHSALATTTAAVTSAADAVGMTSAKLPLLSGSVEFDFTPEWSNSPGSAAVLLATLTGTTAGHAGIEIYSISNKLSLFTLKGDGSNTNVDSNALSWTPGQRYVIRAVWGAGNLYLYRDNVLIASVIDGSAVMPDAHDELDIGCAIIASTPSDFVDGWISNLAFRNV